MAVIKVLSALAEPTRLRALKIIWDGGEHCVCEMMERLDATQSRVSRHMGVLRNAGLIVDRRDAQWVRCRRNPALPEPISQIVAAAVAAQDWQQEDGS